MKMIDKDSSVTLLNDMRYNSNTFGEGVLSGENQDPNFKRGLGAISIFSAMCLSGYYDDAKAQTKSTKNVDIVNRMMDNCTRKVDNTFVKDESWSAKI